ncbi:phage tail tube protein [Limnoglobus roseus]|uniref:Uncharacterized protein n=1 Tax=Limnoglobus roseus TaxID=2598579 RepID=A0A5C1AN16_9BACT|nr:phage tail tube protein [Limnoglobus roseus]QEL18308.1 hypothetical protein PX52LOC_05329 [Limnoglobus roseus]
MSDLVRMGWTTRLGVAVSNPDNPPTDPTEEIEFLDDNVADVQTREDASGTTGIRSVPADRMVEMSRMVVGSIVFEPKPLDLQRWFPRIYGKAGTGSGTLTFGLGNVLPAFDLFSLRTGDTTEDGVSGLHVFRECRVASATFECQEGGRFKCTLNVLGKDRDAAINAAYEWPALTYDRQSPWNLANAVLTVNGTGYSFYRFALTHDNVLAPRMMSGSLSPTEFPTGGRAVRLGLSTPWGNGLPLHQTLRSSPLTTAVLKLAYGSGGAERFVQFATPRLIPPDLRSPVVPSRGEIRYDVELMACATTTSGAVDADSELVTTLKVG